MRSLAGLVLVAFACGVCVLQTCAALPAYPAAILAVGAGGLAGLTAICARRRLHPTLIVMAVFVTGSVSGFGYAAWRADARLAEALPVEWEGQDIRLVGIVDDLPATASGGVRFAFAVERVLTPRAVVPSRLSLAWFAQGRDEDAEEEIPVVSAGERWTLTVRLKRPHGTVNPGGFDLEAWLLQQGFRATGYVRGDPGNVRQKVFAGRWRDYVQRARERIRERINRALPGATYAGVIVALAIGDQRAIPETQWTVFNRTGIAHLVSISGLHVTVFAAFAGGLAYLLARRSVALTSRLPARKLAAMVGVVAAGGYVLLAGAEIPAVRTFAMLAIAACGLWLGRPGTAGIVWLWALVAVLAWDPWAPLTPGFWLSYGAVALLLYASVGRLRETPGGTWRRRILHAVREGAHAQWVVTLGLTPLTLALFQQTSLIAPIANAVAIPVVTLGVVPLALTGIAIPFDALFQLAHLLLASLMRFLEMLAALPDATWQQHAPPTVDGRGGVRGHGVAARAARRSGTRVGRPLARAAFRRAAGAVAGGRVSPDGARCRAGALRNRRDAALRDGLRHGPSLHRSLGCRRPHRRAVPARLRIAARRRPDRQSPGSRSFGRRAVAHANHADRLVRVVVARGASDRRTRTGNHCTDRMHRRPAMVMGRRALHDAASDER